MFIVCVKLTFAIPDAQSLKDKRMVVRSVMDSTRHKFHVSIAEIASQDAHQRLVLGFAVVSSELAHAQRMSEEIVRYMESRAEDAGAQLLEVQSREV